jgi:ATP-dependent DNA helicase DinG
MPETAITQPQIILPQASILIIQGAALYCLTIEGELLNFKLGERFRLPNSVTDNPIMTCHAPWVASKIGLAQLPTFDLLELYAFCRPAIFITPTITGLAQAVGVAKPSGLEDSPFTALDICKTMLTDLSQLKDKDKISATNMARAMGQGQDGWAWSPFIMQALGEIYNPTDMPNLKRDMNVFEGLKEWSEEAPPPPNRFDTITGDEARSHLSTILQRRSNSGKQAEARAQQAAYTTRIADNFMPKTADESPHLLIAQAGTGIGKTYGYLTPAQLWTEKNEGQIVVSTYTKNLQRQIGQDFDIFYPDKKERERKVVTQKGRENYLCLLNLEDLIAAAQNAQNVKTRIAAGIMARWAEATNDGDLTGNSFPGWLTTLLGRDNTLGLADRRGECIYAACDHYHKCFIEGMNRKAKRADIIVNNHALTMVRAATESGDSLPPFIIFDEAHHLFQAADDAYGASLCGLETADLRRWLIGPEDERQRGRSLSRGRGLRKRLEGLVTEDSPPYHDIGKIIVATKQTLPAPGWRKRVFQGDPFGPLEDFLTALCAHVTQRAKDSNSHYSIECDTFPITENLIEKATALRSDLKKLQQPLQDLAENLRAMIEDEADDLDKDILVRLDRLSVAIEKRSTLMIAAWVTMLEDLISTTPAQGEGDINILPSSASLPRSPGLNGGDKDKDFIDWFEITRLDGKNYDCGFYRRYKNPMEPFGRSIRHTTHGLVMTSATLKTEKGESESDWLAPEQTLGTKFITDMMPIRLDLPSPFYYAETSKVIIITDIDKRNIMELANAYKAIFEASKGGGLGIFTAIQRLRQVYNAIHDALERQAIPLYGQHMHAIDIGTLTDMFREDENACLLGTDSIRDGIDIIGPSLRMIIFDRVPWPRPTILHRERRAIFGGRAYDEHLTKLRLKQAYGRLIRSESDRGVFVMLDGSTPSRLLDAFPEGVEIQRLKLKDALKEIKGFL